MTTFCVEIQKKDFMNFLKQVEEEVPGVNWLSGEKPTGKESFNESERYLLFCRKEGVLYYMSSSAEEYLFSKEEILLSSRGEMIEAIKMANDLRIARMIANRFAYTLTRLVEVEEDGQVMMSAPIDKKHVQHMVFTRVNEANEWIVKAGEKGWLGEGWKWGNKVDEIKKL